MCMYDCMSLSMSLYVCLVVVPMQCSSTRRSGQRHRGSRFRGHTGFLHMLLDLRRDLGPSSRNTHGSWSARIQVSMPHTKTTVSSNRAGRAGAAV